MLEPEPLDAKLQKVQKATVEEMKPERITMRSVLGDGLGSVGDVVLKPFRTLAALVRNPGETIREHLFGQRDKFIGPGRVAFLGVTLFIVVNAALSSGMEAFFDPFVWYNDTWWGKHLWPLLAPLLLLPVSALQRRLFKREDMTFAETYSFGLYMLGTLAFFHAGLLAFESLTGFAVHTSTGDLLTNLAVLAIDTLYVAWAATGFYRSRRRSVWMRGAASFLAYAGLGYAGLNVLVWYMLRGMFG